jgi:DNA-directed RNA polymerase specialized sigma24 family protein
MLDRDAPSSQRAIDELNKPGMRLSLVAFASRRMRDRKGDAEDLVQEALAKVLDPQDSPWDPHRNGFLMHVGSIINGLASNELRSARVRHQVLDGGEMLDIVPTAAPLPDEALSMHRTIARLRRLGALLRMFLETKKDTVAVRVLDCANEDLEEPEAVAAKIGCKVEEVHDAHRRLKYHAKQVLADDEEAERRAMKEKREKATTPGVRS